MPFLLPPPSTTFGNISTRHYATAVQMLGQGVQTRVFRSVFRQLADHLGGKLNARSGLNA
jgi:hypothetical protein